MSGRPQVNPHAQAARPGDAVDDDSGEEAAFLLPPAAPTAPPALPRAGAPAPVPGRGQALRGATSLMFAGNVELRAELDRLKNLSDAGAPEDAPERFELRRTASFPDRLRAPMEGIPHAPDLQRARSGGDADPGALRAATSLSINAAGAVAQLMSRLPRVRQSGPVLAAEARAAAAHDFDRTERKIEVRILRREVARLGDEVLAGLAENRENFEEAEAARVARARVAEERAEARSAALIAAFEAAEATAQARERRAEEAAQAAQADRAGHGAAGIAHADAHGAAAGESRAGHAAAGMARFNEAAAERAGYHHEAIDLAHDQHAQTMAAFANLTNRLLGTQQCNWGDWFRAAAARAGDFRGPEVDLLEEPEWMEAARDTYTSRNFSYCLANLLLWSANGLAYIGFWGGSVLVITPGRMVGQLTRPLWGIPFIGTGSYVAFFILGAVVALWVEFVVAAAILAMLGVSVSAGDMGNYIQDAALALWAMLCRGVVYVIDLAKRTPGLWPYLQRWWRIFYKASGFCWLHATATRYGAGWACAANPWKRASCLEAADRELATALVACQTEAARHFGGGRRTRRRRRQQRGGWPGWTLNDIEKKANLFLKNLEKNDPACARFSKEMVSGMKSTMAQAIREKGNTGRVSNMVSTIIGNIFNFAITRPRTAQEPAADLTKTMNTIIKIGGGLVAGYNDMLTPGTGTSFLDANGGGMPKINFDTELQRWSQLPELENKWPEFADLTGMVIHSTRSLDRINVVVATLSRGLRAHALSAGAQKDIQEARAAAQAAKAAAGEDTFHDVPDGTAHVFDGGEPEREPVLPKEAAAKIRRGVRRARQRARRHMMKPSRTKGGGKRRIKFNRRKKTKRGGRKRIKKRKTRHKGKRKRTRRRGRRRARRRHTRR